ncbi:protein kish-B [Mustelus asterias]
MKDGGRGLITSPCVCVCLPRVWRLEPEHERVIKERAREERARGRSWAAVMTNVYSFDGLLVFGLLFICTCAYLKKVPRLNKWLLSEKKGVWGVFYKAAVIGTRLHVPVALSCLVMGVYVLFIK